MAAVTPRYGRERYGGVVYQGTWSSVYPAPSAPTFNTPTANAFGITLSWTTPAGCATYKLERSSDNITFSTLVSDYLSNKYVDTNVVEANTYYYRLTGYGVQGAAAAPVATVTATASTANVPGVVYLYENVGLTFDITKNQPGVQYAYDNVGLPPTYWPIIGRVIATLNDTYGVVYLYENVT